MSPINSFLWLAAEEEVGFRASVTINRVQAMPPALT